MLTIISGKSLIFNKVSLLIILILGCLVIPLQAQQELFNSALNKTEKEDFKNAIEDLHKAANFFEEKKDLANAYKSKAIITYIKENLNREKIFIKNEHHELPSLPEWYKSGKCIGEKYTCEYGIEWVKPNTKGTDFDGILILTKQIRMLTKNDGRGIPVNGILDAEIIPKIKPGEWLNYNCELEGKADSTIMAIVQIKGFENKDLYTKVRQAWKINTAKQKIENIPTKNVACVNHCPGGC